MLAAAGSGGVGKPTGGDGIASDDDEDIDEDIDEEEDAAPGLGVRGCATPLRFGTAGPIAGTLVPGIAGGVPLVAPKAPAEGELPEGEGVTTFNDCFGLLTGMACSVRTG